MPGDTKELTTESPIADIAQYLIEKYYLQPYPGQNVACRNMFARPRHGALHAVCTVLADSIFMSLLKKYFPDNYKAIIREFNHGQDLDVEDERLVALALLCHDIGNASEDDQKTEKHAEIFLDELKLLFNPSKLKRVANAMIRKDEDDPDIVRMRIHDGDNWEFLRVCDRPVVFNKEHLEIVKLFRKKLTGTMLKKALEEVDEIVSYYFGLTNYLYQDSIHEQCEFAKDCFTEVEKAISDYSIEAFFRLIPVSLKRVTFDEPLRIYNTAHVFDAKTHAVIKQHVFGDSKLIDTKREYPPSSFPASVYIRCIQNIEKELKILAENKQAFSKILKGKTLADYYGKDKNGNPLPGLVGFKFRPITKVITKYPIQFFDPHAAFLILDEKMVHVSFRYKSNISSYNLGRSNSFNFSRPQRKKVLNSDEDLNTKLSEMDARRCGLEWDNYDRHYGKLAVQHSESLGHYDFSAVIGIGFSENAQAAQNAILLFQAIKEESGREISFYRYKGQRLMRVDDRDEILYWAGVREENRHYRAVANVPIDQLIQSSILFEGESYERNYLPLNISSITTFSCTLQKHPPSTQYPIGYNFCPDTKSFANDYKAYMHDGVPVIEINDQRYYDTNQLVTAIAKKHQESMIRSCNQLLHDILPNFFSKFGIKYIHFSIHEKHTKRYLVLEYETSMGSGCAREIVNLLGYQHKYEQIINQDAKADEKKVQLRFQLTQALDQIHATLNKLKDSMQQPMLPEPPQTHSSSPEFHRGNYRIS